MYSHVGADGRIVGKARFFIRMNAYMYVSLCVSCTTTWLTTYLIDRYEDMDVDYRCTDGETALTLSYLVPHVFVCVCVCVCVRARARSKMEDARCSPFPQSSESRSSPCNPRILTE